MIYYLHITLKLIFRYFQLFYSLFIPPVARQDIN